MFDENKVITEEARCDICGKDPARPFLYSSDIRQGCRRLYGLVRCGNCGLVYLNPRPASGSILHYYSETHPGLERRKPALYERFYFSFFRNIPLKRKGRLLDVGCGNGGYMYALKELGWDVVGVDIAYTDNAKSELGLEIHEGDLLKMNFAPKSFDAVTFWWTLEHMYEPGAMLKEAHRILKDDGVAVIGVPNIDSPEARLFKKHWFHLFVPRHLYQFSPDSLTKCLHNAGFKKIKIRHDLFSFGIIGSIQCILNDKGIKVSLTSPFWYMLSLPVDMLLGLMGKSGLITAYAFKK